MSPGSGSGRLHHLPDELLFEIAAHDLALSLGRLSCVKALRGPLLAGFRAQRTLTLAEADATLGFGEYLARESYAECIQLSGRRFDLGLLRHAGVVDLGGEEGVELTVEQASVIAPLLRANRRLRWLRLNPGTSWIDVGAIRRGGTVCWRSICKGAAADMHDAECVCVAGLLEPCPPPGHTVRPKSGDGAPGGGANMAARRQCYICFEMELSGLGAVSGLALAAAEARCGGELIVIKDAPWLDERPLEDDALSAFAARRPPRPTPSWSKRWAQLMQDCPISLLLLILACVVTTLRLHEDEYARSVGYRGALLANHPLRLRSLSEDAAWRDAIERGDQLGFAVGRPR